MSSLKHENVELRIKEIITCVTGYKKEIKDDTLLFHDIWICGDDAVELFEIIHKEIGTDFSSFQFEEYFPSEGDELFWAIARFFGSKLKSFKPLRFSALVDAVRRGKW